MDERIGKTVWFCAQAYSLRLICAIGDGVSLVPMRITLSMVAKCAISAIFIIVYLYAPETFPTTIR